MQGVSMLCPLLLAQLAIGTAHADEIDVVTPDLHRALRTYQTEYLKVRSATRVYAMQPVAAVPVGRTGWGASTVVVAPGTVWTEDTWQIQRGAEVLDVPTFLDAVGDQRSLDALRRDVARKRRSAGFWYTVGAAGAAALVGGLLEMERAPDVPRYYRGTMMATGGTLTLMGGLVAGSLPAAKARRLLVEPSESLPIRAVEGAILEHNEALRRELGLSPAQALRAEENDPR